jgi:multidrug efflux pump
MTSLAFTLGVVPLARATGASAASQNAIGTGVLGGMIAATIFSIFFVPVFYVFVMRWLGPREEITTAEEASAAGETNPPSPQA